MALKRKVEFVLKHNPWVLRSFVSVGSAFFKIVGRFVDTDPNLILFTSFSGKKYNDSPKVIYEYLKAAKEGKELSYVWAFEHPEQFKDVNCRKVKIDTWDYFITTLKAGYWVTSVNIERGLKYKKKDTFYLNTWHGPAINLMGNAVEGRSDFNWDHIDRFCISGEYESSIICRDFCVRPEALLRSGLPRNDALFDVEADRIEKTKKMLGIPLDKKVIMYAPTWRESRDGGQHCDLRPPVNMNEWKKRLGEDYLVIVRAHVNTQKLMSIEFDDQIRNYSDYPEVNDLLIVSDYLISDYSSIIMDYSILGRPIICFGYDYDEYKKDRGGFYFDLDREIPSGICYTEKDVLDYIMNSDYDMECCKAREFRDRHIEYGRNATKLCVGEILKEVRKRQLIKGNN